MHAHAHTQAYPLDDESKPRGTAGAMGYPSVIYKVPILERFHIQTQGRLLPCLF